MIKKINFAWILFAMFVFSMKLHALENSAILLTDKKAETNLQNQLNALPLEKEPETFVMCLHVLMNIKGEMFTKDGIPLDKNLPTREFLNQACVIQKHYVSIYNNTNITPNYYWVKLNFQNNLRFLEKNCIPSNIYYVYDEEKQLEKGNDVNNIHVDIKYKGDNRYIVLPYYIENKFERVDIFNDEIVKKTFTGYPAKSYIEYPMTKEGFKFSKFTTSVPTNAYYYESDWSRPMITMDLPVADCTLTLFYDPIDAAKLHMISYVVNPEGLAVDQGGKILNDQSTSSLLKNQLVLKSNYYKQNSKVNLNTEYEGNTPAVLSLDNRSYEAVKTYISDKNDKIYHQGFTWKLTAKKNEELFLFEGYKIKNRLTVRYLLDGVEFDKRVEYYYCGENITENLSKSNAYTATKIKVSTEKNVIDYISLDYSSELITGPMPSENTTIDIYYTTAIEESIKEIVYLVNEQGQAVNRLGEVIESTKESILKDGIVIKDSYVTENGSISLIPGKTYFGTASNVMESGKTFEFVNMFSINDNQERQDYNGHNWSITLNKNTNYFVFKGYTAPFKLIITHDYGEAEPRKETKNVYFGSKINEKSDNKNSYHLKTMNATSGISNNIKLTNSEYATGTMPYGDLQITFTYQAGTQKIQVLYCMANSDGELIDAKGEPLGTLNIKEIIEKAVIYKNYFIKENNSENLIANKIYSEEVNDFIKDEKICKLHSVFWINSKDQMKHVDSKWEIKVLPDVEYTIIAMFNQAATLTVEHVLRDSLTNVEMYAGDALRVKCLDDDNYETLYMTASSKMIENNLKLSKDKKFVVGNMPGVDTTLQIFYSKKVELSNYTIEYYRDVVSSNTLLKKMTINQIPIGTTIKLTDSQINAFRPVGYKPGKVLNELTLEKAGQIIQVLYDETYKIMPYIVEIYLENEFGIFEKNNQYSGINFKKEGETVNVDSLNKRLAKKIADLGYEHLYSNPEFLVLSRANRNNVIEHYFYQADNSQNAKLQLKPLCIETNNYYEFTEEQAEEINAIFDRLYEEDRLNEENLTKECENFEL